MESPYVYDYNEVEDLLHTPHCSSRFNIRNNPNATRIKRDWKRDRYFAYRLQKQNAENWEKKCNTTGKRSRQVKVTSHATAKVRLSGGKTVKTGQRRRGTILEELPPFFPGVEYSLNKRKRWILADDILRSKRPHCRQVIATLSTPKRGENWWNVDYGLVDTSKLNRGLITQAARRGKAKNTTLLSVCKFDDKPTIHFSIVRCYSDTSYESQLLKYRRRIQRQKRRSTSKPLRKLLLEVDF